MILSLLIMVKQPSAPLKYTNKTRFVTTVCMKEKNDTQINTFQHYFNYIKLSSGKVL